MSRPCITRKLTSVFASLGLVAGMVGAVSVVSPATADASPTPSTPTIVVTNDGTPTVILQGGADPGSTVTVLDQDVPLASVTADATTGTWSTTLDLPIGTYTLSAEETDNGATSGTVTAAPFTVTTNNIVENGSFENPTVPNSTVVDGQTITPSAGDGSTWAQYSAIPDWAPTNTCGIELQTQGTLGVTPFDGNQYDELEANCVGGVNQSLPTVPGTQYQVSFAYMARPNTQPYQNTMSVEWEGNSLTGPNVAGTCGEDVTPGSGLQGGSTWQTGTYTVTATSSTTNLEFDATDPCTGDTTGAFLDDVQVVPVALLEPSNTTWLTAANIGANSTDPTDPSSDNQYTIAYPGEDLWYDFPVNPGEQVTVSLGNVPADDQVSLFSDISQTYQAEQTSPPDAAEGGAEASASAFSASAFSASAFSASAFSASAFSASAFSASAFSPSAFSASAFSASAFSASAFSASAFSSAYTDAQIDSLVAVSTTPGAVSKSVTADTWNDTGNFYVRISGNNGATANTPYTLTVTSSGGPCATYNTPAGLSSTNFTTFSAAGNGTAVNSASAQPETVIVENTALMNAEYPGGTAALTADLQALGTKTDGVVVDVSQSPEIQDLVAQAQANPSCPYAENLEASDIQTIINSYRSSNLKYVVIVGDDDIVPFFRYADTAGVAPETDYVPPLISTSPANAALQSDLYLTDDPYGAASTLTIQGATLPLETAAVGRLVETPSDIVSTINNYLGLTNGVLPTPKSTLETGYSFMAAPAQAVENVFTADVSPDTDTPLINSTWSASDLVSALSKPQNLVFLGAHFSANNLLAGDDSSTLTTNQFATDVGTNLENSLVLSPGCHSGYGIDPADAIPGVTDPLAWPQAFAEAGATLIAGTGYQYGDSNYVADSDQLYVDIAQQLGDLPAGTPVAIGTALMDAKTQYLSTLFQLDGIELKSLMEVTLFGLPMLGLDESGAADPAGPTSIIGTGDALSPTSALSGTPGAGLGLESTMLNFPPSGTPTLSKVTVPNPIKGGSPSSYDYYTYSTTDPQLTAVPGGPVLPVQTLDVNVHSETLTGVGFWDGTYTDASGDNPLTGDPATDTSNAITPFSSPVFYPQTNWNPNYYSTLINNGDNELAVTPLQYVSDPGGASTATVRTYSDMHLKLFYDNDAQSGPDSPTLAAAPDISDVTSTTTGSTVNVSATVTGDASAGIQEVWVSYTSSDPGAATGTWTSVDLTPASPGSDVYTGQYTDGGNPAQDSAFIIQAANGVGKVTLDNNYGLYFTPTFTPGAPVQTSATVNTYSLSFGSNPSSGNYLSSASITATLTEDTGDGDVSGQPITFSLGNEQVTVDTGSGGIATATIPLYQGPGKYALSASFAGDPADNPASTPQPVNFTINPGTTTLTLTNTGSTNLVSGQANGLTATLTAAGPGSLTSSLSQKTVYFEVTNSTTNAVVGTGIGTTNANGVAQSGPINLEPGALGSGYSVQAYFALPVTLPGGTQYDIADPDFAGSSSGSPGLSVSLTDPTQTTLSFNNPVYGQALVITANVNEVTGLGSLAVPAGDGTVAFYQGTSTKALTNCATVPITAGTATCTIAGPLAVGPYSFTASYTSNTTTLLNSSGQQPVSIGKSQTTTTLTAPASSSFGAPVLLSAQVKAVSPGAGTPTGTVAFFNGTAQIGSATLKVVNGSDVASTLVDGLQGGPQALSAVYSGDGSFLTSTGTGSVNITFTKTISAAQTGALTVLPGQSVLITSTGKVTGAVSVSPLGSLDVQGGTITGAVSATGSDGVTLCKATIGGAVAITATLGYVLIGGTPACANTISGAVALTLNLGGVEIANTTVKGAMAVTSNLGNAPVQQNGVYPPTEIAGNVISGALACTANVPPPIDNGEPNTAASRSGQCAAAKF